MQPKRKIAITGTALVLAMALGLAGVGGSAAYFSDTVSGGMIVISEGVPGGPGELPPFGMDTFCHPDRGYNTTCDIEAGDPRAEDEAPEIDFNHPYIGSGPDVEPITVSQTIVVENTGENPQDIYIQFGPELDDFANELEEGATLEIKVDDEVVAQYGKSGLDFNEITTDPVRLVKDLPAQQSVEVTFTFTPDPGQDNVDEKTVVLPYQIHAFNADDLLEAPVDTNGGGRIIVDMA